MWKDYLRKGGNRLWVMVMFISIITLSIMISTKPLFHNSKVTTDTLWRIPPQGIIRNYKDTADPFEYLWIRYQQIDSTSQLIKRELRTRKDIRLGQSYEYILLKVDSLRYDLKDPKYKKGVVQNFMVCDTILTYIDMRDKEKCFSTTPILFGSALRYVGDKDYHNKQGKKKRYHIMYGADMGVCVGDYALDSLYLYFDKDMHLKKVIRADGSIALSTREDKDYQ